MEKKIALALTGLVLLAATGGAAALEVDKEASLIAVVTHKAGVAAKLAHNHLVAAGDYQVRLDFDPEAPQEASFELQLDAADLEVDREDLQTTWYPRLETLGILQEPFVALSEKNRKKIHKAMIGQGQLAVAEHPQIRARLIGMTPKASTLGKVEMHQELRVELEVRGERVEGEIQARYTWEDDILTVEAAGPFQFTEFGIKPYSAMLGAVRNQDIFHLYLHLVTKP